jgi:ankyrin repeat protein
MTPVAKAVATRHEDLALFLIDRGADIQRTGSSTPLICLAAAAGQNRVVANLVAKGVPVDQRTPIGMTPLHFSLNMGNSQLLEFLLHHGAEKDVNEKLLGEWTPLAIAIAVGKLKSVQLLVAAKADLSIECDGLNILQYARQQLQQTGVYYDSHPEPMSQQELEERQAIIGFLSPIVPNKH